MAQEQQPHTDAAKGPMCPRCAWRNMQPLTSREQPGVQIGWACPACGHKQDMAATWPRR